MTVWMSGVWLMVFGLVGVFAALALFFIAIKILMKLFPQKEEEENKA